MITENFQIISPRLLEERLKAIEDGINELKGVTAKSIKNEWLTLEEFKEATGIKSYYSFSKMKMVAKEKGSELQAKTLGRKLYIHESEVERYFSGFFQEK